MSGNTLARRIASAIVWTMTVAVAVVITVPAASVVEAAPVQAPLGPEPVCWSIDDTPGLGCVDGPVASKVSGTYKPGSSFTLTTSPNGLAPCVKHTSTGCFYSLSNPSYVRCVYVADGDPTDVRPCPTPLSKQGSVTATRQGTCSGALGSTYIYGGDARFPAQWFSTRAKTYMQCEFAVNGADIDNLYGPTFMLYRTSVRECLWSDFYGCDEPWAILETRTEYIWVPVSGTLAPGEPVAKCDVEVTYGATEAELVFDDSSYITDGDGEPDTEWTFWDASTSLDDVVTKIVTEVDDYLSTTKASRIGKNDSQSCTAKVEPAELEGELDIVTDETAPPEGGTGRLTEAEDSAEATDEAGFVELGEEFDINVDLSAVKGLGALEADIELRGAESFVLSSSPVFDEEWTAEAFPVAHETVHAVSQASGKAVATEVGKFELEAAAVAKDITGATQEEVVLTKTIRVVETLTVNSTGNGSDDDPGDGSCDTGSTVMIDGSSVPECTLRAAIQEANQQTDERRITRFPYHINDAAFAAALVEAFERVSGNRFQ